MAIRITGNDPEYERLTALRRARGMNYVANFLIIIGIPLIALSGVGLLLIILGVIQKFRAGYLKNRYKR